MINAAMAQQAAKKDGFIAALDQSGGSTPKALKLYGIPESAYSGEPDASRRPGTSVDTSPSPPCAPAHPAIAATRDRPSGS